MPIFQTLQTPLCVAQGPKETVTISYVIRLHLPEIQETQVVCYAPRAWDPREGFRFLWKKYEKIIYK